MLDLRSLARALALLASTLALLPERASAAPPQEPRTRAEALFLAHCASCHGERGDGKGWTPLDRPARSFAEGGFSFGNTPETIFRTLTTGIPGTPMPGFESALTEEERRLLAAHVLALGPPTAGPPPDAELVVEERPLFVRGHLPPIAAGLAARPRGMLVGRPDGTTLEYRIDDVRLLGLRQGRFVERTDWVGRGGTPLLPLGRVVLLLEGGDPGPTFELARGPGPCFARALEPLEARLLRCAVEGERAWIEYELCDGAGAQVARVREEVRTLSSAVGAGLARRLQVTCAGAGAGAQLVLNRPFPPRAEPLVDEFAYSGAPAGPTGSLASGQVRAAVVREEEGRWRVELVPRAPWIDERREGAATRPRIDLEPGGTRLFEHALLYTSAWDGALRARLFAEVRW